MANRFGSIRNINDYARAEEEFQMRKAAAAQKLEEGKAKLESPGGGNLPAAMTMANAYGKAIKEGRVEDAANLERFAKTVDKGIVRQTGGGYQPIQGYGQALGSIAGAKQGATTQAKQDVLSTMEPARKEDIATREAEVDLKYRPQIKAAEAEAAAKVGKEIELGERKATLPELKATLSDLDSFANDATYTLAGQAYDIGRTQLGMDASPGAIARTEYDTTISNVILPLLRQTFGAAFTAKEGDSLRATLGDINATPEQKQAAIRSFITQAERSIKSKERELGVTEPAPEKGTKVDGYWFLGGDPADKNNYQKVK